MISWYTTLREDALRTVKLVEVEERYDKAFSRPFGLLFARLAAKLNMTPTQVSILSLLIGSGAGFLLLLQDYSYIPWISSFMLVLAGVLDSSDGQLARMTNQGTELGRVIDGVVDNMVFISVYVCACVLLIDALPIWHIVVIGVLGGAAHSYKATVYEFHKSEYHYYIGRDEGSRVPTPDEVRENFQRETALEKFIYVVYLDYCKKQEKSAFRPPEVRKTFTRLNQDPETSARFQQLYREANQRTLYWWAWLGGTNTQRAGIIIALLLGVFDLYLYLNFLSIIPFYFIGRIQRREDKRLLEKIQSEGVYG